MTRFVNLHYLLDWHTTPPLPLIAPSTLDTFNDTGGSHQPRGNTRRQQCRQHSSGLHAVTACQPLLHLGTSLLGSGRQQGAKRAVTAWGLLSSSQGRPLYAGLWRGLAKKQRRQRFACTYIYVHFSDPKEIRNGQNPRERRFLLAWLAEADRLASTPTIHPFIHSFIHPSVHPPPIARRPPHKVLQPRPTSTRRNLLTYSFLPSFIHSFIHPSINPSVVDR